MNHLYLGIDIGKTSHKVAFLSRDLLRRHKTPAKCPRLSIDNSRAGFETLLATVRQHGEPARSFVLLEHTGHYGAALEQFLQEHGLRIYRIEQSQRYGENKTDELDARAMARLLYNQEELGVLSGDGQRFAPLVTPNETARLLRGLVRHRLELQQEGTQRKNKLISICDELFPELKEIYKDTNNQSALALRAAFPTPHAIAEAEPAGLLATRKTYALKLEDMERLQELARTTIGTRDSQRLTALTIEQTQLIAELQLLERHVEELDRHIETALAKSREGRILMSFVGIGPVHAASLLAGIGNIENFANASKLRSYMGWSPRRSQTGTTYDTSSLKRGGNHALRRTMMLATISAIKSDPIWRAKYDRLVARICAVDADGEAHGKMRAVGHIAGQMIGIIYKLLHKDAMMVKRTPPGEPLPEPELYTIERHAGGEETHCTAPSTQTPTAVETETAGRRRSG